MKDCSTSPPGEAPPVKPRRPVPNGWGVNVLLPGETRWKPLYEPGRGPDPKNPKDAGVLLCTSLAGARAWVEEYVQKGCQAVLVEILQPRRGTCRKRRPKASDIEKKTLRLF